MKGDLACAAALVLYLVSVGAGRALVGVVALLGVCLALHAPQAAAGVVLTERGRVQSVTVTSVEDGWATGGGRAGICARCGTRTACRSRSGSGAAARGRTTRPGDAIALVYDPEGRVAPRGVEPGSSGWEPLRGLAPWAAALVAGSLVAVVRSYRLSRPAGAKR
ncbi:hypothetical protein [Streptomyces sp. TP-A0356]|uniref:hypothetical protein n=1 Tax=Streptomyces sp. TP-A0356 TaxID=1359208 RepID=UPI001F20F54E|nr:hypothetical protein [Streptomyces sp. TP-A0356]